MAIGPFPIPTSLAPRVGLSGLLVLLAVAMASAQPPTLGAPVPAWSPSGRIKAATVAGDTLFLGGAFEQVGPQSGTFATVDVDDASTIGAATTLTSEVTAIEGDGHGGWYVATQPVGGFGRFPIIEHIRTDGTRDPAWTPPVLTGVVRDLAVDTTHVFAVGAWFEINGVDRRNVAAFDASDGTLLPWDAQLTETLGRSGPVALSVATANGRVYISGVFSHAQGQARDSMAVFDAASATLLPYYVPGTVTSLIVVGARIYVGAVPHDLDLAPIASWRPTTVPDPPYAATATAFYGSEFTASGPRIFALDATTGARLPFAPVASTHAGGFSSAPSAMTVLGDRLILGGGFTAVSGQPRTSLAAVDAATGALLPWAPVMGVGVAQLAAQGDTIALGGSFTSTGGLLRQNLTASICGPAAPLPPRRTYRSKCERCCAWATSWSWPAAPRRPGPASRRWHSRRAPARCCRGR
jgi:hypothetical protein